MIKCPACGYANYAADAVACELCHAKLKGGAPPKGGNPEKKPGAKGDAPLGDVEELAAAVAAGADEAPGKAPPKGGKPAGRTGTATKAPPRAVLGGAAPEGGGATTAVDLGLFVLALPMSFPLAAWVGLVRGRDWAGASGWAWVVQGTLLLGMALGLFLSGGADRPWAAPLLAGLAASGLAGCALLIRMREGLPGWAGIGGVAATGVVVLGLSVMGGAGDSIEVGAPVMALAARGTQVLTGGDDLRLFDATTGKQLRVLETGRKLAAVALGPTMAAAGGADDGEVAVWSTKDGAAVRRLSAVRAGLLAVALTEAPEPRLAVGGLGGEVLLYSLKDGRQLRGPAPHTGAVTALAWSPDGRRLASVGADRVVSIYDVEERRDRGLDGHEKAILCVAWSPDGKRLATGAEDGKVRVWDLSGAGQKPVVLASTGGMTRHAWFVSADRLVTTHEARVATLWDAAKGLPVGSVALRALPTGVGAVAPDAVLISQGRLVRRVALLDFKP